MSETTAARAEAPAPATARASGRASAAAAPARAPQRPAPQRSAPQRTAPPRPAPQRSVPQRSAPPRPAPQRSAPPRLRVVTAPRHTRSRAGLVAVCAALLVVGLIGLLLLNVSLERGTYDLRDLTSRAEQLREKKQALETETRWLSAPAQLERKARAQCMVDAPPSNVFLVNGKPVGVPMPAPTPSRPTVTPQTSRSATSSKCSVTSGARPQTTRSATTGTTATTTGTATTRR